MLRRGSSPRGVVEPEAGWKREATEEICGDYHGDYYCDCIIHNVIYICMYLMYIYMYIYICMYVLYGESMGWRIYGGFPVVIMVVNLY